MGTERQPAALASAALSMPAVSPPPTPKALATHEHGAADAPGPSSGEPSALEQLGREPLTTLQDFARRVRTGLTSGSAERHFHVGGVAGCGAPLLALNTVAGYPAPLLYVAPDATAAERALHDLRYLAAHPPRGAETRFTNAIRLLLPAESSPYANVHPDRAGAMKRLSVLAALAAEEPFGIVVTSAAGLLRRMVPPAPLREATVAFALGDTLDLTELLGRLTHAGYLRTPVVEDPGCVAVRGGLLDVWPAASRAPVRVELSGDSVVSLKHFDPDSQRSGEALSALWLPPVRELLLSEPVRERALERLRSLCDAANLPSGKTRRLLEDLVEGHSLFGADGFLPALFDLVPIWDYLPAGGLVLFEQPGACVAELRREWSGAEQAFGAADGLPRFELGALYTPEPELEARVESAALVLAHETSVITKQALTGLSALELAPLDTPRLAFADHSELERALGTAKGDAARQRTLTPLITRLREWRELSLDVIFTARTETQARRLNALLSGRDLYVHYEGAEREAEAEPDSAESWSAPDAALNTATAPNTRRAESAARAPARMEPMIFVSVGALSRGVVAESAGFVLITEEEVFGHRSHHAPRRKLKPEAALEDLRALTPGDYVVHVEHGIGRYLGLEKKAVVSGAAQGTWSPAGPAPRTPVTTVDLLVVEYRGGDKLFVPVYRMNQIQKLSGSDATPKMDRLGGQTFAKTKAKVRHKVREMADELLRLYAERANAERLPVPEPSADYLAFEAAFPFEETPDQAAAIRDVADDMERPRVMDRLVCGDVGFGKTEVALRAAFRHVMAGHQVALLCPTTILANQHYQTLLRRFADYPVKVAVLSRFESKAAQAETVMGLREGKVDIVVGTHRLLSHDVHFKRLGLLVVDEEQRFGVAAKERIKQLRTDIDVLTLSATPIPRTLQLAVGKLQDMSIITTPPADRRAVRTTTARYDEALITEALTRELGRGGQVFYVYNRVEGIYERAARLQALVPRARVAVAHGQLREALLERTMFDFVRGEYDVLVATAIIESGLDIPRANTLIIDRADLFGLAQLYQLRGRVGRSNERAYCYLLVPPPSELTEEARMRIDALTRYTELGSGLKIAELDLELRGAGNFLGAEQSGAVASVGFELFCQMLAEATQELRGEVVAQEIDPEISIDMEALLPETYIDEVGVRLSLYKRLASAADAVDVDRMELEIEDRFGPLPRAARNLVELMRLKAELRSLHVLSCEASAKSVTLHLRDDTPLDTERVVQLAAKNPSAYRIAPQARLVRRAAPGELDKGGLWLARTMLNELAALRAAPAA